MTQITDTARTPATPAAPSATTPPAAPSATSFAETMVQAAPHDPPSAYIARPGPYSVETHGSHIANGVQLIPGAPGYRPELAAPWMQEIAATQAQLAAVSASTSTAPEVVIADAETAAVLADIDASLGPAKDAADVPLHVESYSDTLLLIPEIPEHESPPVVAAATFLSQRSDLLAARLLIEISEDDDPSV